MNELDDFDFVDHYGEAEDVENENLLPDNVVECALNCAFVGIGGGGGKLAKAFLDIGFEKTLLINTTDKDQPDGVEEKNLVLIPDADGVAKNVKFGKSIFEQNSAVVEDALRTRLGKVDWIFVLAGGGGGTGSACFALNDVFNRYLKSVQGEGKVFYIMTWPNAQELLNNTIAKNALLLANDLKNSPHIILDNERQIKFLRGKVGIMNLLPTANTAFAKLLSQTFKLSSEKSSIQTFDSKDLERCMETQGRMLIGTTMIRDTEERGLGAKILQNCVKRSPCPTTQEKSKIGALLLVMPPSMANDPDVSQHLDAAISYVGGRTETLFSGVYVKENAPGLVAIMLMGGLKK
jgi:cell division GTPase FtsZ